MDRALAVASGCHRFKIFKAECLTLLGRYPEAQSVARYLLYCHSFGSNIIRKLQCQQLVYTMILVCLRQKITIVGQLWRFLLT